jgi:hypothetical protein
LGCWRNPGRIRWLKEDTIGEFIIYKRANEGCYEDELSILFPSASRQSIRPLVWTRQQQVDKPIPSKMQLVKLIASACVATRTVMASQTKGLSPGASKIQK